MDRKADPREAGEYEVNEIKMIFYWHIIDFLLVFPRVLTRPRTFLYELQSSKQTVIRSIIFLISSSAIGSFIFSLILSEIMDGWIRFGLLIFIGVFFSTLVCGLWLSFLWGVLGRRQITDRTYVTYLYHASTFNLLLVILTFSPNLVLVGVAGFCGLDSSDLVVAMTILCTPHSWVAESIVILSLVVSSIAIFVWGREAWLAYHDQFSAGLVESITLCGLFCVGAILISVFFHAGVFMTQFFWIVN